MADLKLNWFPDFQNQLDRLSDCELEAVEALLQETTFTLLHAHHKGYCIDNAYEAIVEENRNSIFELIRKRRRTQDNTHKCIC